MSHDIDGLSAIVGVPPRTLRAWIAAGLVPRPRLRGRSTRYGRSQLVHALAVRTLLRERKLSIAEARAHVARATDAELLRLIPAGPGLDAVTGAKAPPTESAATPLVGERWRRVRLIPGLELHLRDGAGELVERLAAEIAARYAAEG